MLSFNYGMKNRGRVNDCIRYGIADTAALTVLISVIFEIFARPLSSLFALTGGADGAAVVEVCIRALRIASAGYVFMGFSVAVQGVLQSLGYALRPLIISLLRLVVFVFPAAYVFTCFDDVQNTVWLTFPIAEILTAVISAFILRRSYKEKVAPLGDIELGFGANIGRRAIG